MRDALFSLPDCCSFGLCFTALVVKCTANGLSAISREYQTAAVFSVQYSAVSGNCHDLPGDEFPAITQSILRRTVLRHVDKGQLFAESCVLRKNHFVLSQTAWMEVRPPFLGLFIFLFTGAAGLCYDVYVSFPLQPHYF